MPARKCAARRQTCTTFRCKRRDIDDYPVHVARKSRVCQRDTQRQGSISVYFRHRGGKRHHPQVAQAIGAIGKGSAQGGGAGSGTETAAWPASTLQVGDAVLKHQLFAVAPVRMGFGVSAGKNVDGLIGWEVLARFVTSFNYAENQVVLTLSDRGEPPATRW